MGTAGETWESLQVLCKCFFPRRPNDFVDEASQGDFDTAPSAREPIGQYDVLAFLRMHDFDTFICLTKTSETWHSLEAIDFQKNANSR